MATVRRVRVDPNDPVGHRLLIIPLITAISQTGVVSFSITPGYAFQVVRVRSYNLVKAGAVSGNLKVGGRTAAALTFTSATEVAQTLSTTLANLRGSATEALTLEYTTDGAGVLTNGFVHVVTRPFPMHGEASTGP